MAELNFRDYLRSLPHSNSQDWGDRYTPTEAELPLKVQTVPSRQSQDPTQHRQEKAERFEVLDGLQTFAPDHVLIIGKPGSGKSTALQRLHWEEAQKALAAIEKGQADFTIPVLMELRDRRDGSVVNWIQRSLRKVTRDETAIEELLFAGRLLLLFDGLNELPTSVAWSALDEFQRDRDFCTNPRIFTTRELGAGSDLGIEKKLEMLPLTEPQMQQFIENRLPGRAESLLRQLKDRLRELAETPLLLKILCDVVQDSPDGQLPQNRGELFQKEFARRYEEFKPSHTLPISGDSRRFTAELFQHLAFTMIQGDPHTDPCKPTPSWLIISKTKAEKILEDYLTGRVEAPAQNAKAWLEDLLRFKLLVVKDLDHIEFLHQLFQEYYAAEKLLTLLPTLSDRELKQHYLNYLKWTEAIAFMLGLISREAQTIHFIGIAFEVDLMLGAKLSGRVKPPFQEKAIKLNLGSQIPQILEINLLGQTQSDFAIPYLLKFLNENSLTKDEFDTRYTLSYAFGLIGSDAVVSAIVPYLYCENILVCLTTIDSLGQLPSKKSIKELLESLKHQCPDIRRKAASKLGDLVAEVAVESLLETLANDASSLVRNKCASALGKIGSKKAISGLVKALEDEESWVNLSAIRALGEIDANQIIPFLSTLLKSRDKYLISAACELLKDNKSDEISLQILSGLEHEFCLIRANAAFASGRIGCKAAIPKLKTLLSNHCFSVRGYAVSALGKLNFSDFNFTIMMQDEHPFVRSMAAEALLSLRLKTSISILLSALKDEHQLVRTNSAYALGRIISEKDEQSILAAFKHRDLEVRRNIFVALQFNDFARDFYIEELLIALQDDDDIVRTYAVDALGEINSEVLTEKLIEALKDSVPFVRRGAIRGLEKIKTNYVASKLLTVLSDSDTYVQKDTIRALGKIRLPISLPYLDKLQRTSPQYSIFESISEIQGFCGFYNYEIAQAAVEEIKRAKGRGKREESQAAHTTYIIESLENLNAETVGNINIEPTIQGDQVGVKYELPALEGECSE